MQRAKASAEAIVPVWVVVAPFCAAVVAALVEAATLATTGEPPPPQPAASSEHAAIATTEARLSGGRHRTMFGSFQSRARKAHHGNLSGSPLCLRSL
jgi:hypothetical protein